MSVNAVTTKRSLSVNQRLLTLGVAPYAAPRPVSRVAAVPSRTFIKVAGDTSRSKTSPARHLADRLAGAFNTKPAANPAAGPSSNNWEEF